MRQRSCKGGQDHRKQGGWGVRVDTHRQGGAPRCRHPRWCCYCCVGAGVARPPLHSRPESLVSSCLGGWTSIGSNVFPTPTPHCTPTYSTRLSGIVCAVLRRATGSGVRNIPNPGLSQDWLSPAVPTPSPPLSWLLRAFDVFSYNPIKCGAPERGRAQGHHRCPGHAAQGSPQTGPVAPV